MWKGSDIGNILQTISALSTAIAAITALITTLQNRNANKKMEEERHALVKPIFIITGTSEDRGKKTIEFKVRNIGYDRLYDILALWEGADGVKVKLIKKLDEDNRDYIIKMDYSNHKGDKEHIRGKLILTYTNILGKKHIEKIEIFIEKKLSEITGEYNPVLQNVLGKTFLQEP
jgi:hypothetical protein